MTTTGMVASEANAEGSLPNEALLNAAAAVSELENSLSDLTRIAALDTPVVRNLLITQRYHDLTDSLAKVLGSGNANWSTFATWASKTAGESIRGEEVPRELSELLRAQADLERHLEQLVKSLRWVPFLKLEVDLFDVARAIIAEVSEQIAEGNLRVFAELTPLFARFAHSFADPAARTPSNLASFLKQLRPGAAEAGGQDLLVLAFTAYFNAASALNAKSRAELVLYGNLLIGLHEQTRLQPNIRSAHDAPLSWRVYAKLCARAGIFGTRVFAWLTEAPIRRFQAALVPLWERLATRFLMRLSLPGGAALSLGSDVPSAPRAFPQDLDPLQHATLIELLRRFDRDLNSLRGSAATNWCELNERMGFICDLFRSQQQDPALFDAPFTAVQRALFEAGKVPEGEL